VDDRERCERLRDRVKYLEHRLDEVFALFTPLVGHVHGEGGKLLVPMQLHQSPQGRSIGSCKRDNETYF